MVSRPARIEALHVAHPAADDDDVRIQDVDHVGGAPGQQRCRRSMVSLATWSWALPAAAIWARQATFCLWPRTRPPGPGR